jgi:hypothetical protein
MIAENQTVRPKEPFIVHCGKCSHEWAAAFLPLPMDVFAKLAKTLCPVCGDKAVNIGALPKETAEGDPIAWASSGDTGISSMTIWSVMMGRKPEDKWGGNYPHDPDDFGRCYRLLKVMPSWRSRLREVSVRFPAWNGLIDSWDELTALYEEELPSGLCPKLYQRMRAAIGARP